MGDGKKGCCGCGPGGALTPMAGRNPVYGAQPPNPRRAAAMFGTDSQDNSLQPTATGHTLPFSSNGVFRLPRHVFEESLPRERFSVRTADMHHRLSAAEAVLPSDTSGLYPNGPAARSLRPAAFDAPRAPEAATSDFVHRAVLGHDIPMPSQLSEPWLESDILVHLQQPQADTKIPHLEDVFPNDTPKDEVVRKDDYAAGAGKFWPMGRISKDDDPHTTGTLPCDESKHYYEFDFATSVVQSAELSYWSDAKVRGRIVHYPAIPAHAGPPAWPAVPERFVEERPPALDPDAETDVQATIDSYLQEGFDGNGHYANGAMLAGLLDLEARSALRKHKNCAKDVDCRMEVLVLRRVFKVIREIGKDKFPKWRRGTDASDYEWETDASGRQVAKRQKIYIEFKVTLYVSLQYWVVVKCIPR